MSATDVFENDLLDLIFQNASCPNVGDATGLVGSTVAGSHYISLHTGTLLDTHIAQTQSEAAYTSYARQGVARSAAGWATAASGTTDNVAAITFPQATGGTETETYFGLGSAVSGAGNLQIYGALTSSLAVSNGITPQFAIGAFNISID